MRDAGISGLACRVLVWCWCWCCWWTWPWCWLPSVPVSACALCLSARRHGRADAAGCWLVRRPAAIRPQIAAFAQSWFHGLPHQFGLRTNAAVGLCRSRAPRRHCGTYPSASPRLCRFKHSSTKAGHTSFPPSPCTLTGTCWPTAVCPRCIHVTSPDSPSLLLLCCCCCCCCCSAPAMAEPADRNPIVFFDVTLGGMPASRFSPPLTPPSRLASVATDIS
jgi:hypothetical protein